MRGNALGRFTDCFAARINQNASWLSLAALVFTFFAFSSYPAIGIADNLASSDPTDAAVGSEAKKFVQLIASYTPGNARGQFEQARSMLVEPGLTEFDQTMMVGELKAISETDRSQHFNIDESGIVFYRFAAKADGDFVAVGIPGVLAKTIGTKALPPQSMTYYLRFRRGNGASGPTIVVSDVRLRRESADFGIDSTTEQDSRIQQAFLENLQAQKLESQANQDLLSKIIKDQDEYRSRTIGVLEVLATALEKLKAEVTNVAADVDRLSKEVAELKSTSKKND